VGTAAAVDSQDCIEAVHTAAAVVDRLAVAGIAPEAAYTAMAAADIASEVAYTATVAAAADTLPRVDILSR
jgi:hypothetical protein